MPTKTQVLDYQPSHLSEHAEHSTKTGLNWTATSETQHSEAQALGWHGIAGSTYKLVASADHATVQAAAEQAHAVAAVATAQSALVYEALQGAKFALEDAEGAQIEVSEQFGLEDRLPPSPDPVMREWRQAELTYHAGQIGTTVSGLISADNAAAAAIRSAGDFSPYHQTPNGHISAVDFKTDKGPPPVSPDPHQQGDKKSRSFSDNFESFTKVVGGSLGVVGGTVLVGAGAATEVGTDGVSSPVSIPSIAGGLGMIATGSGAIEKGLGELFGSGQ